MSFSASTCITNTGTTELGPILYFYSDVTGFGTSFGSDSTENLIGDNCPYIMENIPDGTTIVRIIDPVTNCGVDIVLQSSDLCNICNLNFDIYETQTVSQIVAGNLIGSCDDNISDYIINWYGPGEGSTNLAFTSGYGTEFADIGWDNTHPLTGSQSPLIQAGVYTPVIDRVIVNDVFYSTTGAPGSYIANLNCFDSSVVTVEPLRCDNGNDVGDYSHHYLFENVSVGNPPDSLSASFLLSANTNYLAWKFKGFDVTDRLRLTFYGSFYDNVPIIVEDIIVGGNLTQSNLSNSSFPKSADTYVFYPKVTCLTAFTITEGDYITIEITPNTVTQNTKWDFYFKCLETFDCTSCLDNFKNTPYKIVLSSVTSNLLSCNRNQVNYTISGCSQNQLSSSDTYKYFYAYDNNISNYQNSFSPIPFSWTFYFSNITCNTYCSQNVIGSCASPYTSCSAPSNNTISYSKSIIDGEGFISIEFSSISDLTFYYNSYQTLIASCGIFNDNTQINYYRYFTLKLPVPQDPQEQCGDTTIYESYYIHCSSVVTTGGTGPYSMTITMPTIVKNLFPSFCDLNCDNRINSVVNFVNTTSLSTTNNINAITNVGSKYQEPFVYYIFVSSNNDSSTSFTNTGKFFITKYANETIPSSVNNILIPSLSAQTCQFIGNSLTTNSLTIPLHEQYVFVYRTQIYDTGNVGNFRVYASPITNFQYSGTPAPSPGQNPTYFLELALEYSNGSITYQNPNYCI